MGVYVGERNRNRCGVCYPIPISRAEMARSGLCCGCHTVKDSYYLLGGVMSGGVIDWVCRMLFGDYSLESLELFIEEASQTPIGAHGAWFYPYMDGSGPPNRDPNTWGSWLGLRLHHKRGDLLRAVLEGLSYSSRSLLEMIEERAGYLIKEIRAVGGGTRNVLWQQIKADVLGRPVYVSPVVDMTAMGSAMLAALGVSFYESEQEAVQRSQHTFIEYSVSPIHQVYYNQAYKDIFIHLSPSLKNMPLFIDKK